MVHHRVDDGSQRHALRLANVDRQLLLHGIDHQSDGRLGQQEHQADDAGLWVTLLALSPGSCPLPALEHQLSLFERVKGFLFTSFSLEMQVDLITEGG